MRQRVRCLGWLLILAIPPGLLLAVEGVVRVLDLSPAIERDGALPPWLDRGILAKEAAWAELLARSPRDLKNYYSTYEWDRHLFYRLRPGLAVPLTDVLAPPGVRERTRWTFRTNARGFPGREAPPGPHPGVFRIVCMGDSSTFGWGVESEEAYPALLEQELRRRNPGLSVEVVNLGVCGYSSLQGLVLLERVALGYEPDLVTLSYGSNDWSRVPEAFDETLERNAGWSGAVREVLRRSRAYRIYAAFLARAASGRRPPGGAAAEAASWPLNVGPEKSERNMIEMVRRTRASGADAILVANCVRGDLSGPIRAAARAGGAPLLDTEALLAEAIPDLAAGRSLPEERARSLAVHGAEALASAPDLEVYLADGCHPNPAGHRILARALAPLIESTAAFRRAAAAAPRL